MTRGLFVRQADFSQESEVDFKENLHGMVEKDPAVGV
jgi:hypothetical protein